MKKYIRTKDKIFDMERFKNQTPPSENNFMWLIDKKKECDYTIRVKDIIKEADTIEELCDEFVWVWNKNEFPYSCYRQHTRYAWGDLLRNIRSEENYGKYLNNDYEIYGAIWTNRGLLYVAKLNDKGELELI